MTLIHACALIYQGRVGRDTADICRSAPVKLFILTPDIGRFCAPDPTCCSLHLISTCDCTALLIKLLCYES